MRDTLTVRSGEYEVRILEQDSDGVKVRLMEEAPFAEKGDTSWVAYRCLEDTDRVKVNHGP